jgi:L-histidine Nalpha-methyltransferase / hercynylcysteine S-oxide synthase
MTGLGKLQDVSIIDIRRERLEDTLVKDLVLGLSPCAGKEKTLPTLLLYDEPGLKLFERITYLEEYYLTNAEIDVLNTHADEIAARIPAKSMLVELGSGYAPLPQPYRLPRLKWPRCPSTPLRSH